jgi:aryl-alcohol dehydrogenase-like predicted oxidoreductase/predicted kinase
MAKDWLASDTTRVGLGCMRLSTDKDCDDERALATIAAALDAGITVFDTARSYDENERLLARALRQSGARVVTKGGMSRAGGAWVPDGRAKTIHADCEASLEALDGLAIDLYLVHAPDPRTPWQTTVRALARLVDDGLVRSVGVANVNRRLLDEALELAPVTAVQVALSVFDVSAVRGGVVERCAEKGVAVIAHSPLGGPRRRARLARDETLATVAGAHDATPAQVALAWLLALSPNVVAIPGARRPEAAHDAAAAANLALAEAELASLSDARPVRPRSRRTGAEVVLVMGVPGSGKTRLAAEYVARGFARLNRDEHGGSLRGLAEELDERLAAGAARIVLDNTYLTRASRSYVIDAGRRHHAATRCVWLDTPLAQAQVNLVERLLERHGSVPDPEELRVLARTEQGTLAPTSQMRAVRELEPPSPDEGFVSVERVEFARVTRRTGTGVFIAAAAFDQSGWARAVAQGDSNAPHLVFDWRPGGTVEELAPCASALAAEVTGDVESTLCPHGGGPPICWCRPPLPGLLLAFVHRHGLDPARSVLVGTSSAHRTLATTLGARFVDVS